VGGAVPLKADQAALLLHSTAENDASNPGVMWLEENSLLVAVLSAICEILFRDSSLVLL
jgi:hypothetical protein